MPAAIATILLQDAEFSVTSTSTGLEWMVVASFVVPAVLLVVLLYLGGKHTVRR